MRPSTDGGFLTYPCVLPGCITKAISLGSVFAFICKTRSDWLMDPSLPEKFNISKLFDSGPGANRTDGTTMHFERHPMESQWDPLTDACSVNVT